MANDPRIKLDYLKDKFPEPRQLYFQAHPKGSVMNLELHTHSREEIFEGVTVELLRQLARETWPNLFRNDAGEDVLQIFVNGKYLNIKNCADLDDARAIIDQLEIDLTELVVVKDADGQIVARFVSNQNGEIKRLEG